MRSHALLALTLAFAAVFATRAAELERRAPANGYRGWPSYGGGSDDIRYSSLDQINRDNVQKLDVAWTFDTGDAFSGSEMQCNPIVAHGLLFATTPKLRVIALDAATGKLRWTYDPNGGVKTIRHVRNRGVTYWENGSDRRILFASRHYLYALDAMTGKLIPGFGDEGRVDLRQGLGRDPQEVSIEMTTPGVIYRDLFIAGSIMSEDLPAPPGDIRAYDVRTGKLRWSFHTIPHPGEFGYDTWPKAAWKYSGAANNWTGMAVDQKRGLVFAPTGSASFDFYGSNRIGDDLFANSLIALNAQTGERVWHFQAVKHDLWDRDFPAPPNLVAVKRDGRMVDAVAQITKSGYVFVFDRETGKPLFPIEYRKVPQTDVDGEATAATQPFPLAPPPFARQVLTEDMLTRRTPEAHQAAVEQFRKLRSAGQFVPPSFQGTVIFPGFDGGGEWGGAAFDPASGLLYVNANEMAWILRLIDRPKLKEKTSGRELYLTDCASCHRTDLRGTPPEFPSLVAIGDRRTESEIRTVIREGSGRMPEFSSLSRQAMAALVHYLRTGEDSPVQVETLGSPWPFGLKYTMDGYNKFLDPDGYPAVEPPWGTLNAINLDTGEIAWKIPFGEFPALAAKGMRNTGSENYGGPVVTAGGLLFIGATNHDRKFHAFDKTTGKLLWEATLPAGGNATPAVYEANGREFIVIAAGGGKSGEPSGGSYVAFALPEKELAKK
ncbi:MAG TPA: PQQ-binding-like beta-propeller repeat protein [Bryobacteraceae bacterium]|nr:PQQ-binding-like beta-propeller repeat protein [Bryobacteraceae bacterium]